MPNINSNFLINFGLVTNNTYFALYKLQKGIALTEEDNEAMKNFLEFLLTLNKSINNPFEDFNNQKNFIPIINILNNSKIKKQLLEKSVSELSEIIQKPDKPNGLLSFVKSISDKIDELINKENMQDKNSWRSDNSITL